jgi:mannosyltransferase OCH1-like enzyme
MKVPVLPVTGDLVSSIPRVVHQIWLGPRPQWVGPLYDAWDDYADRWGIDLRRWTDNNATHTLSYRLGQHYRLPAVQVADLLRIEAVALQGGIYMDSDTVPLRRLDPWFGLRDSWFGHGQAWVKSGAPTVSNAMFGAHKGDPFMSHVFEHAAKALGRGVKNTFDIAGPAAIRRLLDETDDHIEVAPEGAFPAYRKKQKQVEARLGRQMNLSELLVAFPAAAVVHRSATSWVEEK